MAAIGALVIGSLQGQVAAAKAHQPPVYQAGGLVMGVDAMLWMSNDMTGQGPVKSQTPKGYLMPSSEMPGMQPVGDNRLRVEVKLSNVSSDVERYSTTDFSLVSPGGKTWHVDPQGRSSIAGSGDLRPGFGMTFDMYFDIPAKNSKHLTLIWSRDGIRESIPVTTSGSPAVMHM